MFGNFDDWENAELVASDLYAWNRLKSRKINQTAEIIVYNDENGVPFASASPNWDYVVPTAAIDLTKRQDCLTSAVGCLSMKTAAEVRAGGGGTWTVRKVDPVICIGLASRMVRYMTPMERDILSVGALVSKHAIKCLQMALATDLASQKLSIREQSFLEKTTLLNFNNSENLWRSFEKKIIASIFHGVSVRLARPTWADNLRANPNYSLLCPTSRLSACLSRINPWWAQFFLQEQYGPMVDAMSFKDFDWRTVGVGNGRGDQLKSMGIMRWIDNWKEELEMRKFQCSGVSTVSAADYDNVTLTNENGSSPVYMCFPFDSPSDGRCYYAGHNSIEATPLARRGTFNDVPHPGLPMTIDTENGMQKKYLVVTGERRLFTVMTEMIPLIVSKESYGLIVGDDGRDVGSLTRDEFKKLDLFRI
jgi:hypothetical protein